MPNWLWVVIVVLVILWLLGLVTHLGWLINILLVIALILAIIWLVQRVRFRR